jgi:hypothetical protein
MPIVYNDFSVVESPTYAETIFRHHSKSRRYCERLHKFKELSAAAAFELTNLGYLLKPPQKKKRRTA